METKTLSVIFTAVVALCSNSDTFAQGGGKRWHKLTEIELTQSRNENEETTVQLADLNGDGIPEILFADPGYDGALFDFNLGRVMVFDGLTGQILWRMIGDISFDRIGEKAMFLKDITGDGIADIGFLQGKAPQSLFLFSGASFAPLNDPVMDIGFFDLIALSDLTGDGTPELLVNRKQVSSLPTLQVLDGSSLAIQQESPVLTEYAELTALGDFNADGYVEFGIFEPGSLGNINTTIRDGKTLLQLPQFNAALNKVSDLCNAGDINGDGIQDVLASRPNASVSGVTLTGKARLISGADGSILHQHFGWEYNRLGSLLAGLGDVDQDGYGDYLVGSNQFHFSAGGPGESILRIFSGANYLAVQEARIPDTADNGDKSLGVLPARFGQDLMLVFSDPRTPGVGSTVHHISSYRFGN